MKPLKSLALLALFAGLAACSSNPMTGRSQLMLVPENQVIAQSVSAYKAELAPHAKKGKLNDNEVVVQRVRAITDRLVAQAVRYRPDSASWAWEVNVIDDPKTLNAFCMPGGKMAIYTGLIDKLKATDDEIAQVMGHEIGHALANHGAEKMSVGMVSDILVSAIGGNNQGRQQVGQLAALMAWQLPNSRGAETEADRIGIELAARAGYDPDSAPQLWKKMKEASGEKGRFDLLSTHPASDKRMEELAALAPHMRPLYAEAAKNPAALPTRLAANVRDVTPGGDPASHAAAPSALRPLTLVNPTYERFRGGEAVLECENCALGFSNRADKLKALDARGDWESLAREVLDVGYSQDIAWYYLGRAAEGLSLREPARRYYQQAVNLARNKETHCKGSFTDLCNGQRLPEQAEAALARLGK
ncbi:MAG: M48 family metallopeptidase [Gallionellaceae bacterium]|nr:M48 family metallopeptidase [Gallionellaceae bacterium]